MAQSEISDLSETDSSNTTVSGYSTDGSIANMSTTDNVFQSILGMLKRWFKTSLFRIRDATDQTKLLAFDLSGQTTALTRTVKTPDFNGTAAVQAKWTDIASAATTNLAAANGSYGDITGTTTITALGTADIGVIRTARFTGILTLTHNAVSLILPGGSNIPTAVGDIAEFTSLGSGNWICTSYQGAAVGPVALASVATTSGSTVNIATAIPAWATQVTLSFASVSTNGANRVRIQLGDSGGFVTTGYNAASSALGAGVTTEEYTDGFGIRLFSASTASVFGSITLTKQSTPNVWAAQGVLYDTDVSGAIGLVSGLIILTNPLTQIRVITTDTFDAGSINARYS